MSTPAQKANLARIRDNQRRSRARRKEYLQELEARVREAELHGIEASAEVQVAARKVAEENRHLRELLLKQGLNDDYITQYLQASAVAQPPDLSSPAALGNGPAVQSLQQTLAPRKLVGLESAPSLTLQSQASREASITSGSTTNSSLWETTQAPMAATTYARHHGVGVVSPLQRAPLPSSYPHSGFAEGSMARSEGFPVMQSGPMLDDLRQHHYGPQAPHQDHHTMPPYHPMNAYDHPSNRSYDPGPYRNS